MEIQIFNFPVTPLNKLNQYSLYITDSWQVGKRLTFNFGTRFDRTRAFLPAQTKEAGQFSTGGSYPAQDIDSWNMPATG